MTEIERAARMIDEAERPLVIAGHGIELGNAEEEFREFIEKADLPVGRTLLGLSTLPTWPPTYRPTAAIC